MRAAELPDDCFLPGIALERGDGGGYHGHSPGLLRNFELGVPIGVHLLEAAGMTATGPRAVELGVPPYPHMLRWLRERPPRAVTFRAWDERRRG